MGRKERVSHRLQRKAASVFGCAEGLPMMNLSSPGACFYRWTFCCCFLLCFSHWCRLFVKMDMRDFYGLYGHIVLGVLYTYIYIFFFFFFWWDHSSMTVLLFISSHHVKVTGGYFSGVGNMSRDVRCCNDNSREGWLPSTPQIIVLFES